MVVDVDNEHGYRHGNISCLYEPKAIDLPDDIKHSREIVFQEEAEKKRLGQTHNDNGKTFALKRIFRGMTENGKEKKLGLVFGPSDWFTQLAVNRILNPNPAIAFPAEGEKTLSEQYLSDFRWGSPNVQPKKEITHVFAIAMCLVTTDEKTLVIVRSQNVVAAGSYSIPINRVMRPAEMDSEDAPDIFKCAYLAANNDMRITPEEIHEIKFFSLCASPRDTLWGIQGVVCVNKTMKEVIDKHSRSAPGKYKVEELVPLDFNVDAVIGYMRKYRGLWNGGAAMCLYHTLAHTYGVGAVEEVLARYE